jgi:TetR/AcrR family transcriptional regulator
MQEPMADAPEQPDPEGSPTPRKRPKPGERRIQILQALAAMLEKPGAERVTTAALAAQLQVSEAALYRHFASKAQMFEGLIDFIEQSVFTLINQVAERDGDGVVKAGRMVALVLQFAERNPGMTRVMVGDALVSEHERLQQRMNQFFDRIELSLRQVLRESQAVQQSPTPTVESQVRASVLTAFVVGRLQRFCRSGFKKNPSEALDQALALLS